MNYYLIEFPLIGRGLISLTTYEIFTPLSGKSQERIFAFFLYYYLLIFVLILYCLTFKTSESRLNQDEQEVNL
jgi:hypothetical protein